MKALKWILIAAGAVGVLAAAIVALVFSLTGGAVDAAEAFFALVGQGKYEEAYRSAAPQFRTSQDFGAFRSTMQRYGLDKYYPNEKDEDFVMLMKQPFKKMD